MFTFMLLLAFSILAYFTVRYFVKNKAAREGLVNQVQADAAKVKKDLTKIIEKKTKK